MKIEKLRKNHKNKVIVGGLISLGVISAIIILPSFAKYKVTQDINIANGVVNYKVPDLNMIAMYTSEDGENYTEIEGRMPDSGYVINEEKSYCNLNGEKDANAILKTVNGNHVIANLIKGDKCYLYFDKKLEPINIPDIIAANNPKDETPDFSKTAITDEGVYKVSDEMYGGDSYYFRGAVTNNYVKFAGFCWRIVRINGDGSIRLIYDGIVCHENGSKGEVAVSGQSYSKDTVFDRSEYVGYTYSVGSQRGTTEESNLKTQTENWYKKYIAGTALDSTAGLKEKAYDEKVAEGYFCNDREVASNYTWYSQSTSTFYYAAYRRLSNAKEPTLSCSNSSDVYSLKVGTIAADEIGFAGGVVGTANNLYYLYNGHNYWTMSPYQWYYYSKSNRYARVFLANGDGQLSNYSVFNTDPGVRPVINLKSDVQFELGTDGTIDTPYEVL